MKKLLIPVFCAAALTFTGCISDFNEDDFVKTTPAIMENIAVDGELANDLRITQTTKMKTEQGVEVVCVRARLKREGFASFILNKENKVDIAYKFTWFDAQGKEVSGANKWQSLSLRPGDEFACTSSAPAKGITKVSLTIRKNTAVKTASVKMEKAKAAPAPKAVKKAKAAPAPKAVKKAKAAPAPKAVKKAQYNKNTNCLCGCAYGEKCYCPEGSSCPNAGKNTSK